MDAARAASLLRDADLVPFLVHPDADSVLAAGLVARALQRAGVPWHARFAAGLDGAAAGFLAEEAPGAPLVLAGLGQRDAAALDGLGRDAIVLDARLPAASPVPKQALVLGDGRAAPSAAVLALPLARALDAHAPAVLALAGLDAAGPAPGAEGLRARLLDEAAQQGAQPSLPPALAPGPLVEALAGSADPFLPGLSGRARASKAFLDGLGIAPGASTQDLAAEHAERLASALALHLLAKGAGPAAAHALLEPDARAAVPGGSARGLARLGQAACDAGRPGLALALALGDRGPEPDALGLADARGQRLLQALVKLEGEGGAEPGLLHADPELAADLAWAVALALRGGAPAAASAGPGTLHVAAPGGDPAFLASAAQETAEAAGGRGWARGLRATLDVPAGQSPEAWAALRTRLGGTA